MCRLELCGQADERGLVAEAAEELHAQPLVRSYPGG
jgi:hypothetical protein